MEELDLKELGKIFWRKKFIIISSIVVFIILGCIYTYNFVEPMYKSTTTIILGKVTSSENQMQDYYSDSDMISQSDLVLNSALIETYSELIKSKTLIKEVKNILGIQIDSNQLIKSISVSRVNNSDLLDITVTNKDSKLARDVVKCIVNIFSEKVKEIYNISNVYIIDDAEVDNFPYNVNHIKDILIFSLIGIFVSFGYVFLYNIIDNTVKSSYDIENTIKSKTLITIPLDKRRKYEELITINDVRSGISEAFKTLRTNIQFSGFNSKESKCLLITSCLSGEGKSYISSNLAIAFAQAGKRVILVDSDMRRGRQSKIFNVPLENGLSNYISNIDSNGVELNWSVGNFIKETKIKNLNIITAGNVPPNPSELLESEKVSQFINELKKYYDIVIFDGAPILPIADSLILGRIVSNVMLVAVYNKTKKDNLLEAKTSIENVGGKVIGVALNKLVEGTSPYYLGYNEYYIDVPNDSFVQKIKNSFTYRIRKIKSMGRRISDKSVVLSQSENNIGKENLNNNSNNLNKDELVDLQKKTVNEANMVMKNENSQKCVKKNEEFQEKMGLKIKGVFHSFNEFKVAKQQKYNLKKEQKELKRKEIERIRQKEQERKEIARTKLLEEKMAYEQEQAKIEEEDRIKNEEIEKALAQERAMEELAKREEIERQEAIEAEKRAQMEAEIQMLREQEKAKKEEERLKREMEKAKIEQDRINKEQQLKLQKEKEKRKREEEKAKMQEMKSQREKEILWKRKEEKQRREEEKIKKAEDLKFTDEYIEENLYPKTKFNKF